MAVLNPKPPLSRPHHIPETPISRINFVFLLYQTAFHIPNGLPSYPNMRNEGNLKLGYESILVDREGWRVGRVGRQQGQGGQEQLSHLSGHLLTQYTCVQFIYPACVCLHMCPVHNISNSATSCILTLASCFSSCVLQNWQIQPNVCALQR